MADRPLVSIVVPSYGHERFVLECLESIHDQTYPQLELVIVDDLSTDSTFERCAALLDTPFRRRFANTVLLRNEQNLGAHASINRGIGASHGSHIAIINSDDRYHPDRIAAMFSAMAEAGSELSFTLVEILADPAEVPEIPEPFRLFTLRQMLALKRDPTTGFALLRANHAVSTGNLLFTRRLFDRVGPFLPLKYCHDWDFVLQSLHFTEPAVVMEPLYDYRLHGTNSFSALAHLAGVESEVVLRRFFRRGMVAAPGNPLCPAPFTWPGYFETFLAECGYLDHFRHENGEGLPGWRTYYDGRRANVDRAVIFD
ncbi:glycosyltransferase family 2 protein [Xanthobacter sediminis]|uniref:glycosyltransferase family 2 protein n=1 Tax=Xanthobacter sediminis TaxID=3119926 RepID=UPI003729FA9A